jgi:hypothetical protein
MWKLLLLMAFFQVGGPGESSGPILPLEEALSESRLAKYYSKTRYRDRLRVLREALEVRTKRLPTLIDQRNLATIYTNLGEIRTICTNALEISTAESNEKERRHKEVKKLEIVLRKLGEILEDTKMEVPLENRAPFDQTKQGLEELREQLLRQLFGKALGTSTNDSFRFTSGGAAASASAPARSPQGLWDLDKFTEEEFSEIQEAQELTKRVEVLLVIAEARFEEIDRRREGREWEEEEPNPLEFHTYEEMFFAYTRALDAVMSNIDDKAEMQTASEKDIKKALKELEKKVSKFIPRLEALEDLIRSQKDEALAEQYLEALKTSEIAHQGALYGLGAPSED